MRFIGGILQVKFTVLGRARAALAQLDQHHIRPRKRHHLAYIPGGQFGWRRASFSGDRLGIQILRVASSVLLPEV